MALNWVMLDATQSHRFIPLPGETTLFASPPRTAFQLTANIARASGSTNDGGPPPQPWSLKSGAGVAYLTNKRIVYIPAAPTPPFESFSAPLPSVTDTHVTAPMFGPNAWVGTIPPVPNGNLPTHPRIYDYELKLTFKDGGTFDFHNKFEQMKERIQNAMELGEDVDAARERGLDELPSYERDLPSYSSAAAPGGGVGGHMAAATAAPAGMASSIPPPAAPDGPPPGYEEVQMAGLAAGFAGRS